MKRYVKSGNFMDEVYMAKALEKMEELRDAIDDCSDGVLADYDIAQLYDELLYAIPNVKRALKGDDLNE